MYENEIYGNSDTTGQTTGNFSGAGMGNFSGANTADFDNANTGYFNHMDRPVQTPEPNAEAVKEVESASVGERVSETGTASAVMNETVGAAGTVNAVMNETMSGTGIAPTMNEAYRTGENASRSETGSTTLRSADIVGGSGSENENEVASANRTANIGMATSADRTTDMNRTTFSDRTASIGMTAAVGGAANTSRTTAAGGAMNTNRTASAAQNTTWTQAPVRKAEEQDKASKTGEKKLGLMQKIMLSISLGLLFGIFAGIGFYGVKQAQNTLQPGNSQAVTESEHKNTVNSDVEGNVTPPLQQASSSVVYTNGGTNVPGIVKDVMPAMVSIVNYYTERVSSFWGQTYEEEVPASGSGIIVSRTDTELLIVTNNHVVEDANRLVVTLIDGTEVQARVKGTDADMDLAVISISLEDLSDETVNAITVATLGDSDNLELGEQVIAIGNALGYGQSVTVGYVSALDRELDMEDGTVGTYIQTDAAINGGNSGGALLNAAGEVIGINSAKIGGYAVEGMGYAIPITAASPIIADLMERQTRNKVAEADMGYMGIEPQDVTDQAVQLYGIPKGVYVVSVASGSGAEAAGMVRGDVITKFDGNKISSYANLQEVLQYYEIGDTVKVTVMRPEFGEYVSHELTLTLGARPTSNMFRE